MYKKLSIIIPIYNVEQYVRACLESVFRQGLADDDYELILVNDGTQDRSMEVIADLLAAHTNVTVINQENQGLSVARNNGLERATGEYVMFLDSDDILIDGSLSLMLHKALATGADIIQADYMKMSDEEIASIHSIPVQPEITWKEHHERELFLKGGRVVVWNKLYRLRFLKENQIRFIPGIYQEDIPFTFECFFKSGMCLTSNLLMIIYRQHNCSIMTKYTMKRAKDSAFVIGWLTRFQKDAELNQQEYKRIKDFVFENFRYLMDNLVTMPVSFFKRRHAMSYLIQYAPDLRFTDGIPQKVITFLYRFSPSLLLMVWWLRRNTRESKHG